VGAVTVLQDSYSWLQHRIYDNVAGAPLQGQLCHAGNGMLPCLLHRCPPCSYDGMLAQILFIEIPKPCFRRHPVLISALRQPPSTRRFETNNFKQAYINPLRFFSTILAVLLNQSNKFTPSSLCGPSSCRQVLYHNSHYPILEPTSSFPFQLRQIPLGSSAPTNSKLPPRIESYQHLLKLPKTFISPHSRHLRLS
jgi:hypothetical protein